MIDEAWPPEWMKVALPVAVLGLLARGEGHGYALLRELAAAGFPSVRGGTLYPLLARQQESGRVTHYWDTSKPGPARKVFSITAEGLAELRELGPAWDRLDRAVRAALACVPNSSGATVPSDPAVPSGPAVPSDVPTSGGQE